MHYSANCPTCGGTAGLPIFSIEVPINCSALHSSQPEAQAAPKGTVALAVCPTCGLIFNSAFDPALLCYDCTYDNSLHFSAVFREYCSGLVSRLIDTYALRGKTVVEIGCGNGDFLVELCERGANRGFGFDPACRGGLASDTVRLLPTFYSNLHRDIRADGVCCRHVLEHIFNPQELLLTIHSNLSDSTRPVFFCEVPNAAAVFTGASLWDINYPHCNYYTADALRNLLQRSHFRIARLAAAFEDQFLAAEAVPVMADSLVETAPEPKKVPPAVEMLRAFEVRFQRAVQAWARLIDEARMAGRRVVLWGVGAKAVSFLNLVPGARALPLLVDSNPRKHGTYVPGTGQQIAPPASLAIYRPDSIINLNPAYQAEIDQAMGELCPDAIQWISRNGQPSIVNPEDGASIAYQNENRLRQSTC